jgi:hypothetical protein
MLAVGFVPHRRDVDTVLFCLYYCGKLRLSLPAEPVTDPE